jgi:PAS domain S-box-containing protein
LTFHAGSTPADTWREAVLTLDESGRPVAGQASLLDLASDAILIRKLPSDTITFWSNGATEMYGWTAGEAVGQVAHRLLDTRFPKRRQAIAQEISRTGRWEGQLRRRHRGGLEVLVESRWTLVRGPAVSAVVEVDRDITRRVAMEIALREAERERDAAMENVSARLWAVNRAKSGLVSGVSHEFRTALTGIQGFSEVLLEEEDLEPDEVRELVGDIHSEALRLAGLIDDLLDLDRMESGQTPLRRASVDLNRLLMSVADRVQRGSSGQRVELRLEGGLPEIDADGDRLARVFTDLFSNAFARSREGSLTEVGSARSGAGVRITVRDRGPGTPSGAVQCLFDQYIRLAGESRAGESGSGLRLPIVRQIVQMHGGRVWAEDASDGGAVVTVELPTVEGAEVRDADRLL